MTKINGKKKGNAYECTKSKELKEFFGEDVITSRSESKNLDDQGVDLVHTDPFYFQLKAVESGINYHKVLKEMKQDPDHLNVVMHKRNRQGEVVAMSKEDFFRLLGMLIEKKT
jgi:DNA modification methylase